MPTQERLHALDAVRAFALLSGIVLHAAMTFMPGLAAFGFPADSSQSPTLQIVFYVIHLFRMTLFFFIAGYFARLMFHRKGAAGFMRDRAKRILVPLLVGWVFFGPIVMGLLYVSLAPPPAAGSAPPMPSGLPLSHLWFLYYLLLIYGATLAVRWLFSRVPDPHGTLRNLIDRRVRSVVSGFTAPLILAAPLAASLYLTPNWIMWGGIPTPDTGLTPQGPAMIAFSIAFVFGWMLHRQSELLSVWKQRWTMHLALAIAFTVLSLWLVDRVQNPLDVDPGIKLAYAASYTLAMWNWVFGIVGSALRFFSRESASRRYIADASYWMYLAHLPVVFALQMLVLNWNVHWSVKFPFIVGTALAVLLLSYRYCVRYTFVGEALNGRRRSRGQEVPHNRPIDHAAIVSGHTSCDEIESIAVAEMSRVHKRYGSKIALDGLDLQVRRGEVLAILGPNGAGKSTAISHLLGLQTPDRGTVSLFGRSPYAPESIEVRRRVGVMLQEVAIPAESRVRDLIELTSSYYPAPLSLDAVLSLTHTTAIANRPYGKLSGGQKRQAQFAMAICGRPQLLFLDEPTTGLDIRARETMWKTLRELLCGGCSIVLTTHYLEEAEALADRIAVLSKGRLVALGSASEVRSLVSRKRISCITTLHAESIRRWPGVIEVGMERERLNITTSDAEGVARRLLVTDPALRELEVNQAGLAEAFVELTQEAA